MRGRGASAEGGEGEEDGAAEQDRGRDRRGEAPKRLEAASVEGFGIGLVPPPTSAASGPRALAIATTLLN